MHYYHQLSKDKKLKKIMDKLEPQLLENRKNVFLNLVRSVAGQQLSTKAAASIFAKFELLFAKKNITPEAVLMQSIENMRAVGFSYSKAQYIHNIADYWQLHALTDKSFAKLTDDEIVELLLPIKGVGKWTIQMLLMFTLGRENIFAPDDLGIQQGMQLIYNWPTMPLKELKLKMLQQAKKYEPFCTYACLYIWQYKDSVKKLEDKRVGSV